MIEPALPWILLPGLDGTGDFFAPFLRTLPPTVEPRPIRYPGDRILGYDDLYPLIREQLPDRPFLVVAESFSGPLAVRLAADEPRGMIGAVISASFVRNPLPSGLARVVGSWAFGRQPPRWLGRLIFAGHDAPSEIMDLMEDVMKQSRPEVIAHRAKEALQVDVTEDLRRCRLPLFFLKSGRDHLILGHNARLVEKLRPDYRVVTLDAAHCLLQTRPEEAREAIAGFAVENGLAVGLAG